MRRSAAAAVALLAVASTLPTPQSDAAARTTIRLVSWNIRHGEGTDGRVDLERLARVLRELAPDVVALQEVDRNTRRTGGVDQTAELARLLGVRGFHGAHRAFQGGEYGNAILTRLPVAAVRTHPLPPAAGRALTALEVRVGVGGGRLVSVVSVHLAGAPEERFAQADSLTALFAPDDSLRPAWPGADAPPAPGIGAAGPYAVLLAGDFNGRPGERAVERLRRDWQILEKDGRAGTYPAGAPDREIDFVMVSPPGAVEVIEHRVVAEAVASDHRPILTVVRVW